MVLRSDYCLYYYKDATKGHLGVISLRDTNFKIRVGQRSDVSWPKNVDLGRTFALVTTPRVYFMYADTKAEADEWRKVLGDTHQDLVQVTRTKSFSSNSSGAVTDNQHVEVGSYALNGARPKALTSACDSIVSTASSVFGTQYTLSSSSEMEVSVAEGGGVESMYNVLQHPLVTKKSAQDSKTIPDSPQTQTDTSVCGDRVIYTEPSVGDGGGASTQQDSGAMYDVLYNSEEEEKEDYETPPDALKSFPQNMTVIVENNGRQSRLIWTEPEGSEAELEDKKQISKHTVEAFYDVAHATEADKRPPETAVYDEVTIEYNIQDGEPGNPLMMSAVNQPLPAVPSIMSPPDTQKECQPYEDIPELPCPAAPQVEVIYEPVGVPGNDGLYSEVEYDETKENCEVGEFIEESPEDIGPVPRESPPSSPIPRPREATPRHKPDQSSSRLPSNESDQSPSNRQNGVPSLTPSLSPRTSPILPTKFSHPSSDGVRELLPLSSPYSISYFSFQVPIPAKLKLSQSSGSPSSPIQPFQRKFSPPPAPHTRSIPRPPSPLLSDRRASVSESSPRSSVSSNPGYEGSLDTDHRPRAPSLKEKVINDIPLIPLFQTE